MRKCAGILLLAVLLPACGQSEASHSKADDQGPRSPAELLPAHEKWDPAFVDQLKSKANALAERELGRLAATEMLYRNVVQEQTPEYPPPNMINAFNKIYRNFTGFEIKDIRRSDSYLRPISYDIEFQYAIVSTDLTPIMDDAAFQRVAKDPFFQNIAELTKTYTYECDPWGDLAGDLPGPLDRPNYFSVDRPELAEIGAIANPVAFMPTPGMPGMPPGFQPMPIPSVPQASVDGARPQ